MRGFVANTDYDWFTFVRAINGRDYYALHGFERFP